MASWMVHLRIADALLKRIPGLNPTDFIIGNIAPDSGVPEHSIEESSVNGRFIPPKNVSHYYIKLEKEPYTSDPLFIHYPVVNFPAYISEYFTPEKQKTYNIPQISFYLGYLAHLLTDGFWLLKISRDTVDRGFIVPNADNSENIKKIKEDWYGLDFRFLRQNPDFEAFKIYKEAVGYKNTFVSEFPENAFNDKREAISNFYGTSKDDPDHEYKYLTPEEYDRFVTETVDDIATILRLPEAIFNRILDPNVFFSIKRDNIGKSGSKVYMFEDMVLKIGPDDKEIHDQVEMMRWLRDKLPVPEVIAYKAEEGTAYLLMTRIKGKMACDPEYMNDPARLMKIIGKAFNMLWNVDLNGCPVDMRLENKLKLAKYNVDNSLVDIENVEPGTFSEKGFKDPEALFKWLFDNQPKEYPVLSHGDLCLPNIIVNGDEIAGFIDLGKMGMADLWCDIAICSRSLKDNFNGRYGKAYPGYDPKMLFKEIGLVPNVMNIYYYLMLDELF